MRNFLLVACLCTPVVFTACKALVRQPPSEIRAVGDAQLTLGVVPIQKVQEGHNLRAYRLLVCKRAVAYPPQLLEDDSYCRVALLDADNAEVIFLPNDFKRDFATKYKGYLKHAVFSAFVIVPLVLAGRLAGKWKLYKLVRKDADGGSLTLKDFAGGKFSRKIIDEGLGHSGLMFYQVAWQLHLDDIFSRIEKITDVDAIQAELKVLDKLTDLFSSAAQLKALGDSKRLYEDLSAMPLKKAEARYNRLEEEIIDYNASTNFDEGGTFTKNFFENKESYQKLINAANAEGISHDEIKNLAQELRSAAEVYGEGLPLYEELTAKLAVWSGRNNNDYPRLVAQINKDFDAKRAELLADEHKALRMSAELINVADRAQRNAGMYALGGGGLALSILSSIGKSIWGYADLQLSQHWHQIFIDDRDFAEAKPVRDIRVILQALADKFGFVVNARALQLATDS